VSAPTDAYVAELAGGNVVEGLAVSLPNGLTQVTLESGIVCYSTDEADGAVTLLVYPWDVALSHDAPDDSALNHVRAPIASLVPVGNRVRVRVGPLAAEVTSTSAERLGLTVGLPIVATFKATAVRLLPAGM
jgi:ABC-type molybdate transport system ATPase subunit